MAKKRISNYIFHPGVSRNENLYPDAYSLIQTNKNFIIAETIQYINNQITAHNAVNTYPYAVTLLTNNRQFIIDEIIAWVAYRVANNISPFAGYTYSVASCRRDTGYLIDALIYDIRYGGNEKTINIAENFWQGGVAQLISPTQEIAGFNQVFSIITSYILPKTSYTSQQSPVTSTQSTSGNAGEAAAITKIDSVLKPIIINVISGGLSTLPAKSYSTYDYAGYIYESSKCNRDIGYVLDAYLHDLRYGGNYKTRYISNRFWNGTTPQISGDRRPEIGGQTFARNLIIDTIIPQDETYVPLQLSTPFETDNELTGETAAEPVILSLSTAFINVLTNGLSSLPALEYGVSLVRLQGKFDLEKILLITNTTTNEIIYNFSDPTTTITVETSTGYISNDYWQDDDFQSFRNAVDYVTTIYFAIDTSNSSANDDIQIFVDEAELRVRPYDYGTDAIERHRVAQPQSMLDADFEYGLQPTKWQAIGIARGYPSVYEIPGTDTSVTSVTTDASTGTGGTGESLITVTTTGPHGFTIGTPFTIKSLANSISGFSRAEGTFIVNSVPTTTTFTYYAQAKVGTSNGQVLATTYTQLRKASFYTGASIGTPNFSVYSNGTLTTYSSYLITTSGSDQMAFTGTPPAIGAPLTGSGMATGAQVTGVVGAGGLEISKTLNTNISINDTSVELVDASSVLEGYGIDNGSGTSIFVTGVTGNTVNFTGPFTVAKTGSTQTYTNVSGTNINPAGIDAVFTIDRVSGVYQVGAITTAGTGYFAYDRITILGTDLGGAAPTNNAIVTVLTVDGSGSILTASISGTSISGDATFSNISQDISSSIGIGALFNISRVDSNYVISLVSGGGDYSPADTLTIYGAQLGGTTPTNNLVITVSTIGVNGDILTFTSSGTSVTSDASFTLVSGTNLIPTGSNATFNVTRSGGSYTSAVVNQSGSGYLLGNRIKILGTSLGGTTPTNDAIVTVTGVSSGSATNATASGTAITADSLAFYSAVTFSEATTASIPDSTTITAAAIAVLQVDFASAHGLVPGASILVDISSSGTNHELARGPSYVESVPLATRIRYTARASGTIDTGTTLSGTIYARPDSYFIHRPYDGGVQLGTGGPQHGAQAIRMSKKYVRYQSGKGINYCTGALFAPSFSIQSISSNGTAVGSYITIVMDDVDHGCQVGGVIKISGIQTKGYNGTYPVSDIINERQLRVQATSVLENVTGTLTINAQMSLVKWHGATVRAGTFDDQNGIYMQYDGQTFAVGKRSSTFQLAGVVNIAKDTNLMTGTNTRFRDQVKAGDRIVIKGMTHLVTNVLSQTQLTVNPDYRGYINAVQAKVCLVQDNIVPQSQFNIDKLDGTGPSGFNIDLTKMQMIGMQWSWYAVGFIDYMLRGSDGNFIFFHRTRNSNVNTEAYMRTGNQPVRYEVINESAEGKLLSSISATQTTIPLVDAKDFPDESGVVMIDQELISFTGKSGNTLTGCTRAAPMTNFLGGAQRTFTGSTAATHEYNTGVILVSNTVSPIISHWGSAMLTDGSFDSDRGYIFNYAATNVSVTTTKQSAFLIRLAPSVSNAIVGDLGERELLNRAQLLLTGIEITADSGTGGIVVEGVLNPQNYPTDPANILWSGLQSSAQGGQPSFAQIAPGGSVSWNSGASQTTATATSQAALTGTITLRSGILPSSRSLSSGTNVAYITTADYNTYLSQGLVTGVGISAASGIPAGTTITSIAFYSTSFYRLTLSQAANANVVGDSSATVSLTFKTSSTSSIFFQKASWEASNAKVGTEVSDALFPANTFVSNTTLASFFATQYYSVSFSQTSTSTAITPGTTTITFKFGQPPYALPGETVFSFIAAPGTNSNLDLTELKELTNTTLGGRGCYPNGPDVLAINVYKASGAAISCNIVLRWGEAQA